MLYWFWKRFAFARKRHSYDSAELRHEYTSLGARNTISPIGSVVGGWRKLYKLRPKKRFLLLLVCNSATLLPICSSFKLSLNDSPLYTLHNTPEMFSHILFDFPSSCGQRVRLTSFPWCSIRFPTIRVELHSFYFISFFTIQTSLFQYTSIYLILLIIE